MMLKSWIKFMRSSLVMGRRRVIIVSKRMTRKRRKRRKRCIKNRRRLDIQKVMILRILVLFLSLIRKDGYLNGRERSIGRSMGIWVWEGLRVVFQMQIFVSVFIWFLLSSCIVENKRSTEAVAVSKAKYGKNRKWCNFFRIYTKYSI